MVFLTEMSAFSGSARISRRKSMSTSLHFSFLKKTAVRQEKEKEDGRVGETRMIAMMICLAKRRQNKEKNMKTKSRGRTRGRGRERKKEEREKEKKKEVFLLNIPLPAAVPPSGET